MSKEPEIVVGICTKNCEDTIQNVLKNVDEGLRGFFPEKNSVILVSDFSEDSTEKMVKKTKTVTPVVFRRQEGGPGKGNGVKTIFKFVLKSEANKLALIDGDLLSIKPEWIKALIEPLEKGFELVVPYYKRHKYDSVITNHVLYPFVACMYGKEIRQPVGGEFALSRRLVEKLIKHPKFPSGFGIDIFITTSALADNMRVAESTLGVKNHASTQGYKNFEKSLLPMFDQVVSTLFELTLYNKEKIKNISDIEKVTRFGNIDDIPVNESVIDHKELYQKFLEETPKILNSNVFSQKTKEHLKEIINNKEMVSVNVWCDALFDAFDYYVKTLDIESVLRSLRLVWMGRLASFVQQTQFMNNSDAECLIKGQIDIFKERKACFNFFGF
ncbi:MAG: hypothetical protein DRP13_01650 [Candidatus Aenigmatarchaeota archaeon]|nr:MAG: hypothetical protein DRP13_01650 [Candidatus Aenigmarchaeota archaeon]